MSNEHMFQIIGREETIARVIAAHEAYLDIIRSSKTYNPKELNQAHKDFLALMDKLTSK